MCLALGLSFVPELHGCTQIPAKLDLFFVRWW